MVNKLRPHFSDAELTIFISLIFCLGLCEAQATQPFLEIIQGSNKVTLFKVADSKVFPDVKCYKGKWYQELSLDISDIVFHLFVSYKSEIKSFYLTAKGKTDILEGPYSYYKMTDSPRYTSAILKAKALGFLIGLDYNGVPRFKIDLADYFDKIKALKPAINTYAGRKSIYYHDLSINRIEAK